MENLGGALESSHRELSNAASLVCLSVPCDHSFGSYDVGAFNPRGAEGLFRAPFGFQAISHERND